MLWDPALERAGLMRALYSAVWPGFRERYGARLAPDYRLDNMLFDYRRTAYAGLVMAVVASMIVVQTPRGDDMFMAIASRHARQVLDLESEALCNG